MKVLTKKQDEILNFITGFVKKNNYAPTIREIAKNFNLSVKTSYNHVCALKNKGKLNSEDGLGRTLRIINNDNDAQDTQNQFMQIPILGEVAAGVRILSEEDYNDAVTVHTSMLKRNTDYFAVKVRGDSMIDVGILDGDIAIIEKKETAQNGDIVVAMINDGYVLKRIYMQESNIKLCSENSAYHPIYTNEIRILGGLVFAFRFYNNTNFKKPELE
ncbi:MAG: transcriptional repressor LexA [Termitinemataceae bacterium]|nr:MAG: transcriptional repressor LexA [Termitinemataceae bacterium]